MEESTAPMKRSSNSPPPIYRQMNESATQPQPPAALEIRLFYVRISPCVVDASPSHLTLRHLRRQSGGAALEINGALVPADEAGSVPLRRDRIDNGASEVTYVSTDGVRVSGAVDFEVSDKGDLMILCGSLNPKAQEKDAKAWWSMDCHAAAAGGSSPSSAFFQPKFGISAPTIEVYIAGCCSGTPLILTGTILVTPRRRHGRHPLLKAIPEGQEANGGEEDRGANDFHFPRPVEAHEGELDGYDSEGKINHNFYSENRYADDDGELTWFNAGVRVGVGIGLGMCLGIGIGIGLLMRSYQATTRTFRRRFS